MDAAVVYLAQARQLTLLSRSLTQLQRNMLNRFPYPVMIFHEGDFTRPNESMLQKICPTAEFHEIDISPPAHIDVEQKHTWTAIHRFSVGYRNMCRFFALGLYPRIRDLDYYMRLDDDSIIGSPVKRDPFVTMAQERWRYAYRVRWHESKRMVEGLIEFLTKLDPRFKRAWNRKVYYNNFHVASPKLWLNPPISDVLAAIDESGGIYTKRWGDAPIQTLLLNTYLTGKEIGRFVDFDYQHGGYAWLADK